MGNDCPLSFDETIFGLNRSYLTYIEQAVRQVAPQECPVVFDVLSTSSTSSATSSKTSSTAGVYLSFYTRTESRSPRDPGGLRADLHSLTCDLKDKICIDRVQEVQIKRSYNEEAAFCWLGHFLGVPEEFCRPWEDMAYGEGSVRFYTFAIE